MRPWRIRVKGLRWLWYWVEGGLRGFAHIGVLRALEERGITPDIIVGTSAGAVVGSAYASGKRAKDLADAAVSIDIPSLMDFTFDAGGLMRGQEIANWTAQATGGKRMEDFPIAFGAVATDLASGVGVLLTQGLPGDAVRASAAVPGGTIPVAYPGGLLVDGGVSSLVPVRFARAMGATRVIAVDIYCQGIPPTSLSSASVVRRTMQAQTCLLAEQELAAADVVIRPHVPMPRMSGAETRQQAIPAGYKAAVAALDAATVRTW